MLQLNEFDEFRYLAYENARLYKEKTKLLHDRKIAIRAFEPRQRLLLYNSRLKFFSGKLKSRWSGPFVVTRASLYGHVEIQEQNSDKKFTVNGQRLKHYLRGEIDHQSYLRTGTEGVALELCLTHKQDHACAYLTRARRLRL
ncbi:uncharacterized protein LOC130963115 [Arachis stenosperma]|uniref:uncharacterized protein LOC130963115 n=1 Tax=Arachis stenosperma TaxID=217475 RepID=UPI0025AC4F39|nr:uncharacterized protein LOC130963115 [Arachis stenosperma]